MIKQCQRYYFDSFVEHDFFLWVGWKKGATQWSLCCTISFVWHKYLEGLDAGQRTEWLCWTKEFQYYWLGVLPLLFKCNIFIINYNSTFFFITLLLPSMKWLINFHILKLKKYFILLIIYIYVYKYIFYLLIIHRLRNLFVN